MYVYVIKKSDVLTIRVYSVYCDQICPSGVLVHASFKEVGATASTTTAIKHYVDLGD